MIQQDSEELLLKLTEFDQINKTVNVFWKWTLKAKLCQLLLLISIETGKAKHEVAFKNVLQSPNDDDYSEKGTFQTTACRNWMNITSWKWPARVS